MNLTPDQIRSDEAEMSALGAMLLSDRAFRDLCQLLEPKHFWRPSHKAIFDAMDDLYQFGMACDPVTLIDRLKQKGKLDEAGGEDYIIQVADFVPSPTNSDFYAKIVLEKFWLRTVARLGADACEVGADVEEIRKRYEGLNRDVDRAKSARSGPISEFIRGADTQGITCGLSLIDKSPACRGLPIGQTTIILAGTKGGKTALSVQLAVNMALEGRKVVYATFADLDGVGIGKRVMRRLCGRGSEPQRGTPEHAEYVQAIQTLENIGDGLYIYDASAERDSSLEAFESWLQKRKNPPEVVVFDYAQRLRSRNVKRGNSLEMAEECSHLVKTMAGRIGFAAIVGSQLTEGNPKEGRKDITKGSTDWQQDCGLLIRLQVLTEQERKNTDYPNAKGLTKATLALSRFGGGGSEQWLQFNESRVGFNEVAS